jgi:hypothetical protein
MLASKRKRNLSVENLEGRALLAGDVSVDRNGNLIIRDEADNRSPGRAPKWAPMWLLDSLPWGDTTINGGPDTTSTPLASPATSTSPRDGNDILAIGRHRRRR